MRDDSSDSASDPPRPGQPVAARDNLASARSELAASQAALAHSLEAQAFLQSVLDASKDCIKVLTFDGDLVFMNDGGQRVMEVDDFETVRGCPWVGFWQGDDRTAAETALAKAKTGGIGEFRGAAATAKGTPKYWDVTVTHIPTADDGPGYVLSISRDITVAKRAEEQRELLSRELSHRVKNSLAVVQALAAQTFRGIEGGKLGDFNGRLVALGAAQDLLLQTSWETIPLRRLVDQALSLHCPAGRYAIDGDDHSLDSRRGLALALAFHELGTNAMKYGALSNAEGMVAVTWKVEHGRLRLTWTESGGPPVSPPAHRGFGTRLVTRNLESDFNGKVELNYFASGVVLTLTAPV